MSRTLSDWQKNPELLRQKIRAGQWTGSTSGLCPGFAQANLAILPEQEAHDFSRFCQRNPKPCPVLEKTSPGDPFLKQIAKNADLRCDLPAYRIFKYGELYKEVNDIAPWWRDDLVGFLLGCSYSFDAILAEAGFELDHVKHQREPGIYTTNLQTRAAGQFKGPLVVSTRFVPDSRVDEVVRITSRYEKTHGAPVHVGDPAAIGIADLTVSEYGGCGAQPQDGETPVFWACGVTPQAVALACKAPFMITHKPGHMFVSDLTVAQIADDGQ